VQLSAGAAALYGTQFIGTGENLGPAPIAEQDRLDERRAAVGLEPFAVYDARTRCRT
jgi:hypothetical protein